MSSNYPGALDNLTARTDSSTATPNAHATDHTDERDAINAIETELGLDPSGASATVRARLDALDTTVAGKEATGVAAALVDDLSGVTNAPTARTNLGLAIGTNVQAWDQDLTDIAGLTRAKGDLIAGSATAWGDLAVGANDTFLVADSAQSLGLKWANASTSRTALGLGGSATLNVGTAASTVAAGDDTRLNTRPVSVYVVPNGTSATTGVGKAYFEIPALLNGMTLTAIAMSNVVTSSSGIPTFQVYRLRQGGTPTVAHAAVAMLSTAVSVDAGEYRSSTAATAAVIDTSNNTVATGDLIRFDCTVAGTGCQGVVITLTFSA
jgi:hypothetical protein